ncbi:MAG TPA: hypothetical protein VEL03_14325 [Streptosporangiaceae bacterium]|nr:hypothetical protein [Streptosporangiaceae bacterium]
MRHSDSDGSASSQPPAATSAAPAPSATPPGLAPSVKADAPALSAQEAAASQPAGPETAAVDDAVAGPDEEPGRDDAGRAAAGLQPAQGPAAQGPAVQPPAAQAPAAQDSATHVVQAGRARGMSSLAGLLAPVSRGWRRIRPAHRVPAAAAGAAMGARPAGEAAAGVLARVTVIPAVLVVAWLLPGLPLLLGGGFLPVPMLLISVPLAAALIMTGLREVPAELARPAPAGRRQARSWTTWFGLLGTVAVVGGLIAWQLRYSSESVIVLRDAGTYLQAAYWIAQHGQLPISQQLAAFGGAHPGMSFASIGFLSRGTSIYPAVTSGMPMLLAAGFWADGVSGAAAVGPILGGLAALSFAGLVARLVGPQWAPAGALILGLSLPQQYLGRSTLSETALQVLLFGGLCLLADALLVRPALGVGSKALASGPGGADPRGWLRAGGGWLATGRRFATPARWNAWLTPERALAGLAGLCIGFSLLVSLDGLIYLLPVIPFAALLLFARRTQGIPFLAGAVIGVGYGAVGAFFLSRPFVDSVGGSVGVGAVAAAWLAALSVVAGQLCRLASVRRFVPRLLGRIPLRWLPEFGALLAAAALIGFAVRPYVQIARGHPSPAVSAFIAGLQRLQGLPVDPTRLYSEQTLYWVIWYIGLPTVLLGGAGLVLVVRQNLRALLTWRDPASAWRIWGLPLAIICAGSLIVLWRPDIVPDQPWASRRLVVIVLPGLIICALWAASWLSLRARSRGATPATAAVVGLFCAAAMLVPTVATTFGLGISHSGTAGGLRPVAQGMALQRTGAGESTAVASLCAQIPRKASVIILSAATASQFSQVVRGMCGVPVTAMAGQPATAVQTVVAAISTAGRRPVLLASSALAFAGYGGSPVRVLDLVTTGDPHELTQLPTAPVPLRFTIWMTLPPGSGFGT